MSQALKILHLMRNAHAGGLSRYVLDLSMALHAAGHDVTVAADDGPMSSEFESAPFRFIRIPLLGGPLGFVQSTRALRGLQPDLIHAHYRRATLLGRRLQTGRAPPMLYTLHLSHMPVNWWRRPLSDFGDHTHVAAEEARDWLMKDCRIAADRITLIHHGIHTDRFPLRDAAKKSAARLSLGLPDEAIVAAYVGRFDDPKNEDWLLDLAAQSPQVHVVLAGGGPHESALRHRATPNVHLLHYRDPLAVYQAADLLLLPSAREGFGLSCAEAMSVGVPVLRTRTSGTAAMIIENVTGRSTPIDHDSFLAAAKSMLSDRPLLDRMGSAAAEHVRGHLTFQKQFDETLALYRRLIDAQRSPGCTSGAPSS